MGLGLLDRERCPRLDAADQAKIETIFHDRFLSWTLFVGGAKTKVNKGRVGSDTGAKSRLGVWVGFA